MTPYSDRIPQFHKAHRLAYTSNSHLIDGPIAKGGGGGRGGGGGSRGGSRGGGGSGGSGGSYGSGGAHVPPIILLPGAGGGYSSGSGGSSISTESSDSKKNGAIIGGVLGGIFALGLMLVGGICFYKKRQLKREKIKDAEAQEAQQPEQDFALSSEGGVAPFALYPPPLDVPAYTPATTTNTTQPEYIAAKSPFEYDKQTPSSSGNLVSAATIIVPVHEKDAQEWAQPTSSQSSSSTLHGIDPLTSAPLPSEDRRAYPIPQSTSPFTTVGVFDGQPSPPPALPHATQTNSVFS